MEDVKADNRDQEDELASILNELSQHLEEDSEGETVADEILPLEENDDLTVLNLPPRKEVHGQKKNRTHLKIRRPLLRFSVVISLVIAVLIVWIIFGEQLVSY